MRITLGLGYKVRSGVAVRVSFRVGFRDKTRVRVRGRV